MAPDPAFALSEVRVALHSILYIFFWIMITFDTMLTSPFCILVFDYIHVVHFIYTIKYLFFKLLDAWGIWVNLKTSKAKFYNDLFLQVVIENNPYIAIEKYQNYWQ